MGYISSVCSGGRSCAALADQNVMGFISAIHELASRERQFYCWLSRVRKLLLTPIHNRGARISVLTAYLLTFLLNVSVQCKPCLNYTDLQFLWNNISTISTANLFTVIYRECVLVIRWAMQSPFLFSLWEFWSSDYPDWSTLHITYLLPT